jgi:hypothetical protein
MTDKQPDDGDWLDAERRAAARHAGTGRRRRR